MTGLLRMLGRRRTLDLAMQLSPRRLMTCKFIYLIRTDFPTDLDFRRRSQHPLEGR